MFLNLNLLILDFLGINRSVIHFIYKNFSEDEIVSLLNGGVLELQFTYNLFEEKDINSLLDVNKLVIIKEKVQTLITNCNEKDIKILSYFDERFPVSLKQIKNPPMFLYILGDESILSNKAIACVGTRKPSKNTLNHVKSIVSDLVRENFTIVSGLAYGVDYESHATTLDKKGKTIAVLAHGLDDIYPKKHKELAKSIVDSGGLLVSEYPLGTTIKKEHFVSRNRIITGLSDGVIVFEAGSNSGTMHSARFAFKQGRPLFCPVIDFGRSNDLSSGVRNLLETKSAYPVKDYLDIMDILNDKKESAIIDDKENICNEDIDSVNQDSNYEFVININVDTYKELEEYAKQNKLNTNDIINDLITNYIKHIDGG